MMKVILAVSIVIALWQAEYVSAVFDCSQALINCTDLKVPSSSNCSAKDPYFDCAKRQGCDTDDLAYKGAVTLLGYSACDGVTLVVSWGLSVMMLVASRMFTN